MPIDVGSNMRLRAGNEIPAHGRSE